MKNILLVGKNSFIGANISSIINVHAISYSEVDSVSNDYDIVINCSLHPDYKIKKYSEDIDIDLKLARKFNGKHIMISSRKVYGTSDTLKHYSETSELIPFDFYSENKIITESKVKDTKEDYLIFRASNVYGFEPGRSSFLGFCIDQLIKNDSIEYNVSPEIRRDFIFVNTFSYLLSKACDKDVKGTFNLSSNIAYKIGNVANNLIKGYNRDSKFVCSNKIVKDQFVLNNKKLFDALDIKTLKFDISETIQSIGKQLCKI